MSQGVWVLVVALVGAGVFGTFRAARDGAFRSGSRVRQGAPARPSSGGEPTPASAEQPETLAVEPQARGALAGLDHPLGERATLLQFSSAFCAPCRATRRVLGEVADAVAGVAHVEIDAEAQLDLVRRLGILRTPTTLVLDANGREVARAAGVPTKAAVVATLARSLDA